MPAKKMQMQVEAAPGQMQVEAAPLFGYENRKL